MAIANAEKLPTTSPPEPELLDETLALALTGRVSFAKLMVLSAMADAECRKAEREVVS